MTSWKPVGDAFRERAEAKVRAWFARKAGASPSQVVVELEEDDVLPGAVLFAARLERAERGTPDDREMPSAVGVYDGKSVVAGREAAQKAAARLWRYGPDRTVPAAQVARVMGFLEAEPGREARPVWDEESIAFLDARWRSHARPPAEIEVDGCPAVVYFVRSRGEAAGFWRSTVVFRGGDVELRRDDPLAKGP